MGSPTEFENLILLVGSNPLPNLLTALMLKPRSILLLYTSQTRDPKDRLIAVLSETLESATFQEEPIKGDGAVAREVEKACSNLPQGAHLNYTGGTKVMAAHALAAFRAQGNGDNQCSYMDEETGLRFDDGRILRFPTGGLGITMSMVLRLHGIEAVESEPKEGEPTGDDVRQLAQKILADRALDSAGGDEGTLCSRLYEESNRLKKLSSVQNASQCPFRPGQFSLELSAERIPEAGWSNDRFKSWNKCIGGGWLEYWVADLMRRCDVKDPPITRVSVSVKCFRDSGRDFEIDVSLVRGHRLYVISCTAEAGRIDICKAKLFEVEARARQLGGDLARSALVCLIHGRHVSHARVDLLRNDVMSVWEARNTPRVFGLDDLREWAGTNGEPRTTSLREWLDS